MGVRKVTREAHAVISVAEAFLNEGLVNTKTLESLSDRDADALFVTMENMVKFVHDERAQDASDDSAVGDDDSDTAGSRFAAPTCFAAMCAHMGVDVPQFFTSVSELESGVCEGLRRYVSCRIGYTVYSEDDPRNHVVPVAVTKSGTVDFTLDKGYVGSSCTHGVTSPQEFFNPGGRFSRTKFYADSGEAPEPELVSQQPLGPAPVGNFPGGLGYNAGFGGDVRAPAGTGNIRRPPPPESVDGSDVPSGGANVTGGVVRPKKRVIRATTGFDRTSSSLRNYTVAGATMFNNVDELFLNTISRPYAQEILEFLFQTWGVPSEEPEAMRYAEDIVFAFLIARTASNKADYNVAYDVPTRKGAVEADFAKLSVILADHYGITRRNFCRGIADDLRDYLRRPENQPIKSRAAARVGADPQYGHLCFDGSTECSNMTTSEQKFTKVLEAKGLYESDAVLADGASATLMEGIHGGTRSIVSR